MERRLYREVDLQLNFMPSDPLTIGVEFELALLDGRSLEPAHLSEKVVAEANSPQIKPELYEHMIEVTSAIGADAHQTEAQLRDELARLNPICKTHGLRLTGTGLPPTIRIRDIRRTHNGRYDRLYEERRALATRFSTLGMHIHLGMVHSEQCIRYHSFLMHFLPHLIALSASTPFEEGVDSGLATIRPCATESLPVAGMPYHFRDWQEYVNLCRAMYRAGSIESLKDLWWDLRPCPRLGTLEVRICDQPATLAEGIAIVAFVHSLAHWFQLHQSWLDEMPRPNTWRLRENKWRAMRYGLQARIVVNNRGETEPICDDIRLWLDRIAPISEKLGYGGYMDELERIMQWGNSTERQLRIWNETENLESIARFNCDEFDAQLPSWNKTAMHTSRIGA